FKLDSVLRRYPGIYYVSGHLHALQYFYTKDHVHYIISGAGSKENKLSEKEIIHYDLGQMQNDFLIWNSGGFFELEFNAGISNTILYYDNALLKCSLED
ncbi:MAG TPA: hypothetical protein VHT72_06325, partial [Puia sp.]|nr:hypothetical protein [Puia sp.]